MVRTGLYRGRITWNKGSSRFVNLYSGWKTHGPYQFFVHMTKCGSFHNPSIRRNIVGIDEIHGSTFASCTISVFSERCYDHNNTGLNFRLFSHQFPPETSIETAYNQWTGSLLCEPITTASAIDGVSSSAHIEALLMSFETTFHP